MIFEKNLIQNNKIKLIPNPPTKYENKVAKYLKEQYQSLEYKIVYDNLGFINPLLENKLNHHNYYWSSDEAKHGGEDAWFMNMANGRVLDYNIYDLPISVRVFSAV